MTQRTHRKFRVPNADMRRYVEQLKPFQNKNETCHGEWGPDDTGTLYAVFSYRTWPMFIYDPAADMWFENTEKVSVTTSSHHTKTRPHNVAPEKFVPMERVDMLLLISAGSYAAYCADRIRAAAEDGAAEEAVNRITSMPA